MKKLILPATILAMFGVAAFSALHGQAPDESAKADKVKASDEKKQGDDESAKPVEEGPTDRESILRELNASALSRAKVEETDALCDKLLTADDAGKGKKLIERAKMLDKLIASRMLSAARDMRNEEMAPALATSKGPTPAEQIRAWRQRRAELNRPFSEFMESKSGTNADQDAAARRAMLVKMDEAVAHAESEVQKENDKAKEALATKADVALVPAGLMFGQFPLAEITAEQADAYCKQWLPADSVERATKLFARGMELHKKFDDEIKKCDTEAASKGATDLQIRNLAARESTLKQQQADLNRAFAEFLPMPGRTNQGSSSIAVRLTRVAAMNDAITRAEQVLDPKAADEKSARSSSRGGPRPSGFGGRAVPPGFGIQAQSIFAMTDDELKSFLDERFPAPAIERVTKIAIRARELAKTLDERVAAIDTQLAEEKLSDETMTFLANKAQAYRSEKGQLINAFANLSNTQTGKLTMSQAVEWYQPLSQANTRAEASLKGIDELAMEEKPTEATNGVSSLPRDGGFTGLGITKLHEEAIALKKKHADGLTVVNQAIADRDMPAEQRKACEEEKGILEESVNRLTAAIAEYQTMRASVEPVPAEKFIAVGKQLREAVEYAPAVREQNAFSEGAAPAAGGKDVANDPIAIRGKLYDRAKELRGLLAERLNTILATVADPNTDPTKVEAIESGSANLLETQRVITMRINEYERVFNTKRISSSGPFDENAAFRAVVAMRRAIADAEKELGIAKTLTFSADAKFEDVTREIKGEGQTMRVQVALAPSPLVGRLIAACENLKNKLDARSKEVDAELAKPDLPLKHIEGWAHIKSKLDEAIDSCNTYQTGLREGKHTSSNDLAYAARDIAALDHYLFARIEPRNSPPVTFERPQPDPATMSGYPGMMPGMPGLGGPGSGLPGGGPGMTSGMGMPGMAGSTPAPSPEFAKVNELRMLYKKAIADKNDDATKQLKQQIREELARVFDAQNEAREKQLTEAREKLKKLEEQQSKRAAARDEMIESRAQQIIRELEGTEWKDE